MPLFSAWLRQIGELGRFYDFGPVVAETCELAAAKAIAKAEKASGISDWAIESLVEREPPPPPLPPFRDPLEEALRKLGGRE